MTAHDGKSGTIIKSSGGFYTVSTSGGLIECRARGIFRKDGQKPCVGDRVNISVNDDGSGLVEHIQKRRNFLIRPPLANLDVMVAVLSVSEPPPNLFVADKFIAVLEYKHIEPYIAVTKSDLQDAGALTSVYKQAGFSVFQISAETGEGVQALKDSLSGKFSAFSGNSGVGKTSLLNAIDPRLGLEVGEISKKLGRGRHTTRTTQIFTLDNGGRVADTPGFSSIDIVQVSGVGKEDMQRLFREFEPYIKDCRFQDCTHTAETGCGVIQAAKDGKIAETRYLSYKQIFLQLKDIKEWERKS
ncbi:MAG: ribosome small subunit-dependent GTPase A [Oscillospiraceae bacterium]|nr:ribosome small subunit-dependent GTPase A [Oscillospiraceae bacterium]